MKELGTNIVEQKIYKNAKNKERDSRDLGLVRCIKNEISNILTTNEDVMNRWEKYFISYSKMGMKDPVVSWRIGLLLTAVLIGRSIVELLDFQKLEKLL